MHRTTLTKTIDAVKLDGVDDPVPTDMIEALIDVDGYMEVVLVDSRSLRKQLEEAGLIRTNIRGGSYATATLKNLYANLEKS